MAKHTKKWQSLYKSVMGWQTRARAKDSRLRKAGARNVSEISPVVDANQLQNMTYHELERYRHSLNVYTDRNNSYIVLESGEAVRRSDMRRMRRLLNEVNRTRRKMVERLESVHVSGAADLQRRYAERAFFDPITHERIARPIGTGSPLEPVVMTVNPTTASELQSRIDALRRMRTHDFSYVAEHRRKSVMGMAASMNNPRLIDALRDLTDMQLMFAVERMGLIEKLEMFYQSNEEYSEGYISMRDLDPEGYEAMQESIIDLVPDIKRAM